MSREQGTLVDLETVEALDAHPDLLAIADAIAATQRKPRGHSPITRSVVVAAVLGLAIAAALISPWQGRGSGFVERALVAIGDGQVIHVISVGDQTGQDVVDLQTGSERPVHAQNEVWFDASRGLERTISSIDGRVTGDELQTPRGSWTQSVRHPRTDPGLAVLDAEGDDLRGARAALRLDREGHTPASQQSESPVVLGSEYAARSATQLKGRRQR